MKKNKQTEYEIELINLEVGEYVDKKRVEEIVKKEAEELLRKNKKANYMYIIQFNDELNGDKSAAEHLSKLHKMFEEFGVHNAIFTTKGMLHIDKIEIVRKKTKKNKQKS